MSLTNILAQHGVTVEQARAALAPLVATPDQFFAALDHYKLTTAMVAELAGVSEADARGYFAAHGLDAAKLDAHASVKTDYVFLSDLSDGDIFIYNPQTGEGQEIYSFGRTITDIAVAGNGDIYATDFNGLYRFEWATGQMSQVVELSNSINSLAIEGNYLALGSSTNNDVDVYDLMSLGHVATFEGSGAFWVSQGDLAFVDGALYRTAQPGGLVRIDLYTGQSQSAVPDMRPGYYGLAGSPDGEVLAFNDDGEVRSYSPQTGMVTELPDVQLVGLNTVSGAAEVLQMHLYGL